MTEISLSLTAALSDRYRRGFQFAGWPDWSADGERRYFAGWTQDGARG
jgi:hypothetical protein